MNPVDNFHRVHAILVLVKNRDIVNARFGVNTTTYDDPLGITSITTTPQRILDNDPGRVALYFINTGGQDILVFTDPSVSATKGIRIGSNGGFFNIDVTTSFELCTREWWAVAVSATSTLTAKSTVINGAIEPKP